MSSKTLGTSSSTLVSRIETAFEQGLFAHRILWLVLFAIASVLLAWQALQLRPEASQRKLLPVHHPFIENYLKFENELRPLGNSVRIAIENTRGDIYDREFLDTVRKITDEVFYIPGVDRGNLRSLWTPNALWVEATEDGLRSGKVVPADFARLSDGIEQVRSNIVKAGIIGSLVANDHRSTVILAPLLETDPETGQPLNYGAFTQNLEDRIRAKYQNENVRVHIVGFAKLVGDLIHGSRDIALFFLLTVALTAALLLVYSRCWRSTLATIGCCLLAVVWHLGIIRLLGFRLDPYSILVPFLTFAIGVSHAVQNINTFAGAVREGKSRIDAARATFLLLFVPGTVALLCDVVGFSTLLVIDIGVIRELALSASVGIAVIIFTKMFLLPILMSYAGMSEAGRRLAERRHHGPHRLARAIASLADRRRAVIALVATALLAAWGVLTSQHLQIGDIDPGAPELRTTSIYNRDTAFFGDHSSPSSDVFVVIVKTPPDQCGAYPTASLVSRLQWALEETPGVESTLSLFDWMKQIVASNYGGTAPWASITRNHYVSNSAHKSIPQSFYNNNCSMLPVIAYLADHKAATLERVVDTVQAYRASNPNPEVEILLGAGNAGIEAATNSVVHAAWLPMLVLVYAIVACLLLLEFRSLKAMICMLVPLIITSTLCEAVMVKLGLGVKVATLPVIALGVGIGVDYGIYLYNRLETYLQQGLPLREAYFETMKTTGLAVAFTGITLAAGVLTWAFSEIKFQSDMGILLTFMFLWNMVGAVALIPAIAAILNVGGRQPSNVSARPALAARDAG